MSACAALNSNPSAELPKPIDCDAEALKRCEAPEIEHHDASLEDTEEVDAINRHRWLRCIYRHNAAVGCFEVLRGEGVIRGNDPKRLP